MRGNIVKDGEGTADNYISCSFLWYCSDGENVELNCDRSTGNGATVSSTHWMTYRNRTIYADEGSSYHISCYYPPTGGGGPAPGACDDGGYWQQYFWYVNGVIVDEWWEFECGWET